MQFLANYGLFLLQAITLVLAILIVAAGLVAIASRGKEKSKNRIKVNKINEQFDEMREAIHKEILTKDELKQLNKAEKKGKKLKKKQKTANQVKKRLYVLDFHGDIRAAAAEHLRHEVTAILLAATGQDEILVRLESPGGLVNAYGLAASQLKRITDRKIPLTIAVDKVAASGGYMMASVANKIISAPFAIIGSIGVVAQIPNFHKLLKKSNIDFEQITAGEYKRTLTLFGENTDKGREKFQQDVDDTHLLFKNFIKENRPIVNIDETATGEYWYGTKALELKLADELITSDDYLMKAANDADIYHVKHVGKKSLADKFFNKTESRLLQFFYRSKFTL